MDNKSTFLWALAIICITIVAVSPVACTVNRQLVIEKAVKNGADPIAMKCALESSDGVNTAMCIVKAADLKKQ